MMDAERTSIGIVALLLPMVMALLMGGCGGGGSGSSAPGPTIGSSSGGQPAPIVNGSATVTVSVADPLGQPAPGADVWLNFIRIDDGAVIYEGGLHVVADEAGIALFRRVPAGLVTVSASYVQASIPMYSEESAITTLADRQAVNMGLAVSPGRGGMAVAPTADVVVDPSGADLNFLVRLAWGRPVPLSSESVQEGAGGDSAPTPMAISLEICCIRDDPMVETSFPIELTEQATRLRDISAVEHYALVLLLEQSAFMGQSDPQGARLLATKYLLTADLRSTGLQLAAFAADDAEAGYPSALPVQPVTFLPDGSPPFTAPRAALMASVDELEGLVGGRSPLYAAIQEAIDLASSDAIQDVPRKVVVVTTGRDDTCAPSAACRDLWQGLIAAAAARQVAVTVIVVGDAAGRSDRDALAELAARSGGFGFWENDPSSLGGILASLDDLMAENLGQFESKFRIQAAPGTFRSGQTLLGTIRLQDCSYGCWESDPMPIAIRVP